MDFALSDEQTAIFDMAHAFGQDAIAPHAHAWDKAGQMPRDLWPQVGALGFGGLYISEDSGGSGLSRLDATLVFEALSMACPSVAAFLSIHNMCAKMIDSFGDDALKARVMPGIVSMDTVLSYCLTEPGSGSDAAALKTRAERTNDGYILNGNKAFISGGGYSDAYVTMVRTGADGAAGVSTVYVENGADGLSFGGLEDKMGWRNQPTAQVQFDNCHVPAANLVGEEGHGFKYAMMGLDGGRLNIAACSLGAAQQALNATLDYMGERKAFGTTIDSFQGAPDATKYCAMAKKFVTEAGSKIVDQCLQLHGGYGYLADYGIEKLVRDLRVHQILEGTNEIMRVIVSRDMLKNR